MTDTTAQDLGVRVVVRHRLAGGGATDVLGHLVSWSDGTLVIASRQGEVPVAEDTLLAIKRIPEPPSRRS